MGANHFGSHDANRIKKFRFLISDCIGLEGRRRLHAKVGKHLKHMILDHVAQHARGFIILTPAFNAHGFHDAKLNMINMFFIPKRLKNPVGKAERKNVLYCFLAQIMINAVNLFFFPML